MESSRANKDYHTLFGYIKTILQSLIIGIKELKTSKIKEYCEPQMKQFHVEFNQFMNLNQRNTKEKQKTQEQSKIEYLSDMKKDNAIFEEIRNQCKEKRWNSKIREEDSDHNYSSKPSLTQETPNISYSYSSKLKRNLVDGRRMLKTYLNEEPVYLKNRRENVIKHIYRDKIANQSQYISRNSMKLDDTTFGFPSTIIYKKVPKVKPHKIEDVKKDELES